MGWNHQLAIFVEFGVQKIEKALEPAHSKDIKAQYCKGSLVFWTCLVFQMWNSDPNIESAQLDWSYVWHDMGDLARKHAILQLNSWLV